MEEKRQKSLYISESFLAFVVILVALLTRLLHVLFTAKLNPLALDITLDAAVYDRWAKALVWGGDAGVTGLMQAPLFPWFVSMVYRVAGPSLTAVRLVQAVMGTFTCGFITVATRRLFRSSAAGIFAGLMMALYLPAVFYEGVLVPATLILFLNSLFLLLMVPESRYPVPARALAAGFVLGLSTLAKPVALLILPFAVIHLAMRIARHGSDPYGEVVEPRRSTFPALFRSTGLLAAGLVIALAPLTIRNYRITGEFIPLTTGGGINFYIGNNPRSNGYYSVPFYRGTPLGGDPEVQRERMHQLASAESKRELSPSEVSDFWFARGLEHIRRDPGQWAALSWRKFLFFWNKYERASVESLYFHRRFPGILPLPLLTFGFIAPLGLLGIFLTRGRWRRLWLLYGGLLAYLASAIVFYVLARYRLPAVAFLIPLAGASLTSLLKLLRDGRRSELVLMIAALFMLALLVNTTVAVDTPSGRAGQLSRLGIVYAGQGEREKARAAFLEALTVDPSNSAAKEGLRSLE